MKAPSRALMAALAASLALAAIAGIAARAEGAGRTRRQLEDYRGRIGKLASLRIDEAEARMELDRLTLLVDKAESRRLPGSAASVAELGRAVESRLAARNIFPGKLIVLSGKSGALIELSVKCRTLDLLRFLADTAEIDALSIPYLSLRAGAEAGFVEAVLRVGR